MTVVMIVLTMAAAGLVLSLWHIERARRLAADRLGALVDAPEQADTAAARHALPRSTRLFPPRYRFAAPSLAILTAAALTFAARLPIEIAVAAGMLVGVLAYLLEDYVADEQSAKIEMQLADAIDLLVGSLRAGSSLLAAFESALQESEAPLRPYFQEVAGRIRLGDDARVAVGDLPRRVPLETFKLFAASLAIHWEVGGSLATTLATVGRTVRDRIELSRRVRAQGVEAHASVAVVLVLAYLLGFLMWRANPERLEALITSGVGTELVAGVIVLQAVGLVWMSKLSRSAF
jgi:tight adherence protein B